MFLPSEYNSTVDSVFFFCIFVYWTDFTTKNTDTLNERLEETNQQNKTILSTLFSTLGVKYTYEISIGSRMIVERNNKRHTYMKWCGWKKSYQNTNRDSDKCEKEREIKRLFVDRQINEIKEIICSSSLRSEWHNFSAKKCARYNLPLIKDR